MRVQPGHVQGTMLGQQTCTHPAGSVSWQCQMSPSDQLMGTAAGACQKPSSVLAPATASSWPGSALWLQGGTQGLCESCKQHAGMPQLPQLRPHL
jgi:hypothetical protein